MEEQAAALLLGVLLFLVAEAYLRTEPLPVEVAPVRCSQPTVAVTARAVKFISSTKQKKGGSNFRPFLI
jgi:hypothetical protein